MYSFFRRISFLYIFQINIKKNLRRNISFSKKIKIIAELIYILINEIIFEIRSKFKFMDTSEIKFIGSEKYKNNRRPTLINQIKDTNNFFLKYYKNLNNYSAMDIGCGSGKVLYGIEKLNYKKIYGIEINEHYFENCKKNFINNDNIKVINQDFFEYNIDDIEFFYLYHPFDSNDMYEKLFNIFQKLNSNIIIVCFDLNHIQQKLMSSKNYECIYQKDYLQKFNQTFIYKKIVNF